MTKYFNHILVLLFISLLIPNNLIGGNNPKLVVGIVVDQMRFDYLNLYSKNFSKNGFKKLLNDGYSFNNIKYNYIPTLTAPGLATIYTGTTPSIHGIVANNWYDRNSKQIIYSLSDSTANPVGVDDPYHRRSSANLKCTTITDELRIRYGTDSKIISISIKDRAAVLPAGISADGAYWFDSKTGNWISSDTYMQQLPQWVNDFNAKNIPNDMLNITWNLMLPMDEYISQRPDDNEFEDPFPGETSTSFPHVINGPSKEKFYQLKSSPYGNSLTTLLALQSIEHEKLGLDSITDFLAISYSSPDYVGHKFGVASLELEDTFLRLDREIGVLIDQLDQKVGKGEYLLFLTSDHGAAPNPSYHQQQHGEGGFVNNRELTTYLNDLLNNKFKVTDLVLKILGQQVYLNESAIKENKLRLSKVEDLVSSELLNYKGIVESFTREQLINKKVNSHLGKLVMNGYQYPLSGNVVFCLNKHWLKTRKSGSDHGSGYDYDTHVPLILYGKNVKHGSSEIESDITQIVPTICGLSNIPLPANSNIKKLVLE